MGYPGDSVDIQKMAKTKSMKEVGNNFKYLIDEFFRTTFETKDFPKPVSKVMTGEPLTATTFVDYLTELKTAFLDSTASGGHPDLILMDVQKKVETSFIDKLTELKPESYDIFPDT